MPKQFFTKLRRKLRSAFSLKLRFLKIQLLVTRLKCLFKKNSNVTLTGWNTKALAKLESKQTFSEISVIFFKKRLFFAALITCVHAKRLRPLQPPVLLSSICRDERVNDEPVKVLNLLFFYFISKWRKTCQKLYLFEKLAFKKNNGTPTGCKAWANLESKQTFSESSFNFLQNSVVFCTLYSGGYTLRSSTPYNPRCNYHQLAEMRELTMSQ